VLLELGEQPLGRAGWHARVARQLGHGQLGGLVAQASEQLDRALERALWHF